jgi:hypothetical protein
MKYSHITFNSGRTYTQHGQRIAAADMGNGIVAMSDVDRGIDYVLKNCALDRYSIMNAYDMGDLASYADKEAIMPYAEFRQFFVELRELAFKVASV